MENQNKDRVTLNPNINFRSSSEGLRFAAIADGFLGRVSASHSADRAPELSKGVASVVQPVWAAERLRLLLQIFAGIQRKVNGGASVAAAIRAASKRWEGKCFKTAPDRAVNFSAETLSRLWYRWQKAGRDAAVLQLNYRAGGSAPKVSPQTPALLAGLCLDGGAVSFAEGLRILRRSGFMNAKSPSYSSILRHVPRGQRAALRNVFTQRQALKRTMRQARALVAAANAHVVEGGDGI